jgi:hypothetical protein
MATGQDRIIEGGAEDRIEQALGRPAAATVRHLDGVTGRGGNGTADGDYIVGHRHYSAATGTRR